MDIYYHIFYANLQFLLRIKFAHTFSAKSRVNRYIFYINKKHFGLAINWAAKYNNYGSVDMCTI